MGSGGTVLLQQQSALSLQTFTANTAMAGWTHIPEDADNWTAVAMDNSRLLLFHEPDSSMAICTLDETGAPVEWLPLQKSIPDFVPIALEKGTVLAQNGPDGTLKKIHFDETGNQIAEEVISESCQGWLARGMNANRIVLEHVGTGHVAVWAANPTAPLFHPYTSFIIPDGWSVRDFAADFVLIQQGETGSIQLVELGEGYQVRETTELVSAGTGWRAVALAK